MGERERVWEKEHGKASFSRLKGIFGDRVKAKSKEGQESEIRVRIWMLNEMMEMEGRVGYMALR